MSYTLAGGGLYLLDPAKHLFGQKTCLPTRPDILGPFYRAAAPERYELGTENNLVVYGYVRSTTCEPLLGATIEVWQATPDDQGAEYIGYTSDDYEYYATLHPDKQGYYEFYTDMPGRYPARPMRHIHFRVTNKGYGELVTQLYFSDKGTETEANFDLTLIPKV